MPSNLYRQATDIKEELLLSLVRSKTTPKMKTFYFRLPSVAQKRLCLSSLLPIREQPIVLIHVPCYCIIKSAVFHDVTSFIIGSLHFQRFDWINGHGIQVIIPCQNGLLAMLSSSCSTYKVKSARYGDIS